MTKIKDCCIICLAHKENDFENIFSKSTLKSELALIYEDVFNLEINEKFDFPQYMCPYCTLQLKLLNKFKKKAVDTYRIIENINIENIKYDEKSLSKYVNKTINIIENNQSDEEIITNTISLSPISDPDVIVSGEDLDVVIQEINYNDLNSNMKTNDDEFLEVQFLDNESNKDGTESVTIASADDDEIYDDITIISNISPTFMEEEEIYEEYAVEELKDDTKILEQNLKTYSNNNIKSGKNFQCMDCNITFYQKLNLVEHRKEKHPRHSCDICSKRFLSLDGYNSHMKIHMGLPGFKCDECGKTFNQKQHLIYHTQSHHSNERNFPCDLCSKRFVAKSDLKIHMRVHNDERRYECDICKKKFRAYTHMTNHRYSHFEKCLECPHCHLKYASPSSLKTHIRSVHEGLCPHKCEICQKKFKRRHHLLTHLKTHNKTSENKEDIIIDGYVLYEDIANPID